MRRSTLDMLKVSFIALLIIRSSLHKKSTLRQMRTCHSADT